MATKTPHKRPPRKRPATLARECEAFNREHPVGTPVRYWRGVRQGEGKASKMNTSAQVVGDHTAVVWVEGHGSCIALSHVEVLPEPTRAA